MAKKTSSTRWLQRHVHDPYVREAQIDGYFSRAAYKLLELDKKYQLFRSGMQVLDLGAAPGSWSQVAVEKVGVKGRVIAVDILPIKPVPQVIFLKGSIYHGIIYEQLLKLALPEKLDLVISDMAPNLTGIRSVDQQRAGELNELSLSVACRLLKTSGTFLVKVFHGEGFADFVRKLRSSFGQVEIAKPSASRNSSSEVYIVAKKLLAPISADEPPSHIEL